jgi:catechol 2,3-dioxygenase-like lactoylglutathione lyase family enzyme
MNNNIKFNGSATIFVVADLSKSIDYFRDVLGFKVAFIYGDGPMYAGVERSGVIIHLFAAARAPRPAGQSGIYIFLDDGVDALYEELKSRGARLKEEPKDYPYRMRDFDLEDLDGNRLSFGAEVKTKTPT